MRPRRRRANHEPNYEQIDHFLGLRILRQTIAASINAYGHAAHMAYGGFSAFWNRVSRAELYGEVNFPPVGRGFVPILPHPLPRAQNTRPVHNNRLEQKQSSTTGILRKYQGEAKEANNVLSDKICKLRVSPETQLSFLSEAEIEWLDECKEQNVIDLLKQYREALSEINQKYSPCQFSFSLLEELDPCLTIEFKLENKKYYRYYDLISFLNYIGSCSDTNKRASITDNRVELDGQALQLNEDESRLQLLSEESQEVEIIIYKGFHREVMTSLNKKVKPSLDALRGILAYRQKAESKPTLSQMWQPSSSPKGEVSATASSSSHLDQTLTIANPK